MEGVAGSPPGVDNSLFFLSHPLLLYWVNRFQGKMMIKYFMHGRPCIRDPYLPLHSLPRTAKVTRDTQETGWEGGSLPQDPWLQSS